MMKPKTSLLHKLNYPQKFTLISLLFILPLVAFYPIFAEQITRTQQYGYYELYGTYFLRPLQDLLEHVQEHNRVTVTTPLELPGDEELNPVRAKIQQDFELLDAYHTQYAGELQLSTQYTSLKTQWTTLEENYSQLSQPQLVEAHAELITSIRELIRYIGDTSFLILDPDLDTYYLMDAILLKLPETQVLLDDIRTQTASSFSTSSLSSTENALLPILTSELREQLQNIELGMATSQRNDENGNIGPAIAQPLQNFISASNELIDNIEANALSELPTQTALDRLNELANNAQTAQSQFYDAASGAIEVGINERIARYSRATYLPAGIGILSVIIGFLIGLTIMRRISRPLGDLADVSQQLLAGDLTARVNTDSQDEVGRAAQAFNEMVNSLQISQTKLLERNQAISTSAEVSRQLTAILDPSQLVHQIVDRVQSAFNYNFAQIYLLEDGGRTLKMVGGTGKVGQELLRKGHSIPTGKGLVGRAARTKMGVLASDVTKEPDWIPNPLLMDTKSEIAVPIISGEKVLGVLDVQVNKFNRLYPEDLELLQSIANQAAIALQNAQQYEQTQLLFLASQSLASSGDYQEMLDAFIKYVAPQADQGGLLVFSNTAEGELLAVEYVASWSKDKAKAQPIEIGTRFAPDQVPFISLFSQEQPLIVSDLQASVPGPQTVTPEIAQVLVQFGVQSLAGFPLIIGGRLVGGLLFGYANSHVFTERELQPVQAIASQMATLLRNQQLLEEFQVALTQLDVINRRLTREGWREFTKLSGGLEIEDIAPGLYANQTELAIQNAKNGHATQANTITAPISVRGEEIGLFSLQRITESETFTDEELELLQIVADEVAVALENIRLLEETQQNALALEESRNLLDSVVENLPVHLFVKEAKDLRFVRWNKAGEDILGVAAADVVGKTVYEIFDKETADRSTAQDWEVLTRQGTLEIAEEEIETPHMGTRIVHTRKTPVLAPDGQPRYLIGLSEDITERKQAEKALQELETLYRRAIASADAVPYSRRYSDEAFSFIGEGIESLTGYLPSEFSATLFDSMILENKIYSVADIPHESAVQLTRAGKVAHWKADYRIRARDGQERWLGDSSVEIIGPDGISIGSVGILTDITERKRAEETLSRQLKEMENLNAIGQLIATEKDLDRLLISAGEKICETFNVDSGYVALYDSRSEIIQIPFYLDAGQPVKIEPQPLGVGLASRVVKSHQTLFIPEMTQEIAEELGAYIVGGQIPVSWLGTPILSSGGVIGVISVQHTTQPNWFKEADVRLLSTIAANLSTAIQNIRLLEQTQKTLSELEQLTRRLTRESWEGYLETMTTEIGYVFDLHQVAPIQQTAQENGSYAYEKSIVVQGQPIGHLAVAEAIELDSDAEELLTAVSNQLSAHIENLRLLEETERGRIQLDKRAAELSTVAEVSTTTATELNPDELLHKVVNLTKSSFGLYHAHIYLVNEQDNTLVLAAGAGDIGMQMVMEGRMIPIEWEQSLVARVARNRTGVVVNDVHAEADFLPHPLLPNTRAELAVPLIVGNTLLGVLDVQSEQVNYFTEEDIRIQSTLASQIAVALQNARLYVEQAATVQRLRELDHLKSSFLANMSHELRTPLNSIIGFTEIILEGIDGPLTDFMEGDLKIIQKNGKHLLSLINDVLDMAKIEAGRMNLSYERFMLSELLEDVVDITTSLAHDKQLYLRIESDDAHETELLADRIRLRQVLINVVGNAIKFTETGGITLRSRRNNGKLCLNIVDTGIGIPPEKLENIFDHFSQVDTSTTRKAGGTGLGLPISRRLVELHQGQLFAESSGIEGEGSTFTLILPLETSSSAPKQG